MTGSISGVVTDASGAAIAGAKLQHLPLGAEYLGGPVADVMWHSPERCDNDVITTFQTCREGFRPMTTETFSSRQTDRAVVRRVIELVADGHD